MEKLSTLLIILFSLIISANAAPIQVRKYLAEDLYREAIENYNHKDYKTAYEKLHICEVYPACKNMLGFFYANGLYVDINKTQSIQYFQAAAEKKNVDAAFNLGTLYLHEKKYKKALKYLQLAADQNHKEANYNIGLIYIYGLGVKKDYQRALDYMQTAKKLGYEKAKRPLEWIKNRIE